MADFTIRAKNSLLFLTLATIPFLFFTPAESQPLFRFIPPVRFVPSVFFLNRLPEPLVFCCQNNRGLSSGTRTVAPGAEDAWHLNAAYVRIPPFVCLLELGPRSTDLGSFQYLATNRQNVYFLVREDGIYFNRVNDTTFPSTWTSWNNV